MKKPAALNLASAGLGTSCQKATVFVSSLIGLFPTILAIYVKLSPKVDFDLDMADGQNSTIYSKFLHILLQISKPATLVRGTDICIAGGITGMDFEHSENFEASSSF